MSTSPLLDALSLKGVLIAVSVRYWRARKQLTAEDLGLRAEQIDNRLISLGHKRLIPKETLQALALVESRAHAVVEGSTFPFLNVARYLPNERLAAVTERLDELSRDFEEARDAFLASYDGIRQEALTLWRELAEELGSDPELLLARIAEAFPPSTRLAGSFGFSVNLFQVALPELPQAELVEQATQEAVIAARQSAAADARVAIQHSCEAFVADTVATLREQTATLCQEMLATINGKGYVHQRTLNRLASFIDDFRALNFANDKALEQQLDEAREQLLSRTAESYRNDAYARDQLLHGLSALRDKARTLAGEDAAALVEHFGQLGRRRFHLAA